MLPWILSIASLLAAWLVLAAVFSVAGPGSVAVFKAMGKTGVGPGFLSSV